MSLKPQDVLLAMKLTVTPADWSYRSLAADLGLSVAEVHQALRRAAESDLVDLERRRTKRRNLLEFLLFGLKYSFPARTGSLVRGMPTSFAGPPLNRYFTNIDDMPPVWPDATGSTRGYEMSPLYSSAPEAAKRDSRLYELLVLCDAIREGRTRERKIAQEMLTERLQDDFEFEKRRARSSS